MSIEQTTPHKRLLVLTSTFPRWEGDHEPGFVFELSRRLAEDIDVIVLAPHARGTAFRENFGKLRIRRFPYFFPRWENLAYDGGIVANLKKYPWNFLVIPLFIISEFISVTYLLKKYRIDVIHAHWLIPQGMIAVVARRLARRRPRLVCTAHGSDLLGLQGKFFNWIKRWTIAQTDKLTVVSNALRDTARTHCKTEIDIEVIPMGVDLQNLFVLPRERAPRAENELLCVGRLVPNKGISYIVRAMPHILKSHPLTKLIIVGDGPDRNRLTELVNTLNLAEKIEFVGALNHADLSIYYQRATIFISASLQEGFGLVLAEAMGCGCPVIATELPAVRDIIINGKTGLLCRQQDSDDIVTHVRYLLDNPEKRQEISQTARKYVVEQFDWTKIARRYGQTILDVSKHDQ